jgi:hypothetical protein
VTPLAERARLVLGGASRCAARVAGGHLVACDDRGRVLVLDLAEGALRRDLRL